MGYKTTTLTNKVSHKIHVTGDFMGKYYGTLNHKKSFLNSNFYDIHIYDGEIRNLKNEIQHPEIINETIYNAILSEASLAQKSFENVLVDFDNVIGEFDSFTLTIKKPKLLSVTISDVVKKPNQAFGTIHCKVSGFLLKSSIEKKRVDFETCDQCGNILKDCDCDELDVIFDEFPVDNSINNDSIFGDKYELPWWKNYGGWNWNIFDSSGFSRLGLFGLFVGVIFLLSLGLPGFIIGLALILIFSISKLFTWRLPHFNFRLNWLIYSLIGLLLFGLLFTDFCTDRPVISNPNKNIPKQTTNKSLETQKEVIVSSPQEIQSIPKEEIMNGRRQIQRVPEIMAGTVFEEGEVYICNGPNSKRYHLNPNCSGLSNCSTKIYMVNVPVVQRKGRTLCELEK
ncbi:hypothetical protein [uncultured Croceitalea sp.]|uniref:hypothetical protein n=1 Tax=uncultured Croceitalea sp. TaxID=1798908 RepID=UPI003306006C